MTKTKRGSLWRLWDFHAHTPASYLWNGQRLRGLSGNEGLALVKQMVEAINASEPDVFVIMDYWTEAGYLAGNPLALARRRRAPNAPRITRCGRRSRKRSRRCRWAPSVSACMRRAAAGC